MLAAAIFLYFCNKFVTKNTVFCMKDVLFSVPELLNQGKSFVLCTVIETLGSTPRKEGARMIVFPEGNILGTVGGGAIELQAMQQAQEVMKSGKPIKIKFKLEENLQMQCGGMMELYFEPFFANRKLYIFGAGHVGREVGRYAAELGFNVSFIDHRADIYDEFSSSYAQCIVGDYVDSLAQIEFSPRDFVVITTPKHEFDQQLLGRLAQLDLAYLGMIGSKRKVAETSKNLLDAGQVTQEQLSRVNMPIGIPFRAETPAEIAISIIAKIIDIKNSPHS
jgi:xanthine dehydrogenase accessory factor